MKKFLKVLLKVLGIILGIIAITMIIGFVLHSTYFKSQLKAIEPYGKMVTVDNKNMHVYSMGNGKETIVLLPGHGVPLPSAEFGPLMRELSQKYTVVTIEYFGTGFSDETDLTRTSENYMNEIRTALAQAGFKPPYILMPHSISGIYSEYYASKYPEEVSGIIMLDSTSTAFEIDTSNSASAFKVGKFMNNIGFTRALTALSKKHSIDVMLNSGYTLKEIEDYSKFYSYAINDTIINQIVATMNCINETKDLPFPNEIPVLKIVAKETLEAIGPIERLGNKEYQEQHIQRLGNNASYVVLEGSHFIYHTQIKEITKLTDEFVENLK